MPHYRTTTITGSELIPGFLDGTRIFLTRPQVISLLAATEVSSPIPFRKATAPSSASRVVAVQGGVLTNFDRTEFATYLAATGTPDPVPAGRGVSSITGRERIEGMQGNTRVGLDVSEAVDFRDNTDLSSGATPTPTPSWVTTPDNNRMLFVGDSRANVGTTVTATNSQNKNTGLPTWVGLLMGQRIAIQTKDYGTGGATISNILNNTGPVPGSYNKTLDQIFAAEDSSTVHILWGVNQWTSTADDAPSCAAALAQAKTDTLAAIALANTYRRRIMFTDHPSGLTNPATGAATGMSALRQQLGSDYDDWLKTLPAQYPWVFYTGQYRALAVNATGPTDPIAGMLYDSKHSLSKGAATSATAMVPTMTTLFPVNTPVFAYATAANQTGNLVTNGQLAGTPGSVPTGWALSAASGITPTHGYNTNADGENEYVLTLSGSTAVAFMQLSQTLSAFSAGDIIRGGLKISVDAGHTGLVAVGVPELRLVDGVPITTLYQDFNTGGTSFNAGVTLNPMDGETINGPVLTPATAALQVSTAYTTKQLRIYAYFLPSVTVSAVIRMRCATVKKVN